MIRFVLPALFFVVLRIHADDVPPYPTFPDQAEFLLESIILDGQHERTVLECIYDYQKNKLIIETEETWEFYDYSRLMKAVYWKNLLKRCDVYPIDLDNPLDGMSAVIDLDSNSTHIRPLNEFFLLPSSAMYHGMATVRGFIHVDQWLSTAPSNETETLWSMAKMTYTMPWSTPEYTIPVQRLIKNTAEGDVLQVLNVFHYKTSITKTDLSPPKGIYCPNLVPNDDLLSLQDFGMTFPAQFSVRIDASTTARQLWQSVHLRYYSVSDRKLIRYDYTPSDNTQNPRTVLLDYSDGTSRAYQIDRRSGACVINQSAEIILATSVVHNPIETLIKYESLLLSNPPHGLFQFVGNRSCRGSLMCSVFIGQMFSFPPDSDSNWFATNIEWGWSKRAMDDPTSPYDYPVYLNLNLYKERNEPPATVHYEFYDFRTDIYLDEFDVSLCYRSNQLSYQHLVFRLQVKNSTSNDAIESNSIDRRRLNEHIRELLIRVMAVKDSRISQLELDHQPGPMNFSDTLYCIFTLLDRTPFVNPNSELDLAGAQQKLTAAIDAGDFQFETDEGLALQAVPRSLENVPFFYPLHGNLSGNPGDYFSNSTNSINRTTVEIIEIREKIQYSDGAQAGAVIGGMVIGILAGTMIVLAGIQMMKRKANTSPTGGLTFRNISFRIGSNRRREDRETIGMENPVDEQDITDS